MTGLDPDRDCSLFRDEVFADVLGVVRLPAPDVESYLARAVGFANEALAGSLGATLLVDPETEAHHRQAVTDALAGLRYGFVGLNEHAGYTAAAPQLLWGAYPGNTPEAIGSGVDFAFNTLMLPLPSRACCEQRSALPSSPTSPPPTKPGNPLQGLHGLGRLRRQPPQDPPHVLPRPPRLTPTGLTPATGTTRELRPANSAGPRTARG